MLPNPVKNKSSSCLQGTAIIGATMQRYALPLLASLSIGLLCAPSGACAQDQPKPINPNDPRLTFSFAIQPGGKPFRFVVELDKIGTIAGVSTGMGRRGRFKRCLRAARHQIKSTKAGAGTIFRS